MNPKPEDAITNLVLPDEKKAKILKELNEEIERQKAKYLLNNSRAKESTEIKIEEHRNYDADVDVDIETKNNPHKQIKHSEYDNHIDMLESAKDNLKKIQLDIQSMSKGNLVYNDGRDDKGYENYELRDEGNEEEHLNTNNNEANYQLEDEGEEQVQVQVQEQGQNKHIRIKDNEQYDYHNVYSNQLEKDNVGEEENLEEEEPKDLEHEISISNHNYTSYNNNNNNNEYVHINTNQSNYTSPNPNLNVNSYSNSNRNTNPIGGYNFFNPIDYNPNKHKGSNGNFNPNPNSISKKSLSKDKCQYKAKDTNSIYDLREKSFEYTPNYRLHQLNKNQSDHNASSPYFKRMAKLYTPKYKSKEKYEIMKKDLENKFALSHPFKPEINYTVEPKIQNESNQQRYERLSQPKTVEIEQRMKKKEQMIQEQIKEHCNFNYKPITNNNQPQTQSDRVNVNVNSNPSSTANKLYKLHDQLKEKKEKMKREYEDNKIKEYSFAPEINKESKLMMQKYDQRPIYERSEDFEKARNDNLLKMRQEIEREQSSYYKPVINEKSKELANKKSNHSANEGEAIHERLYRENIRNEKHNHPNPQLEECTFTPKLNYESYDNYNNNTNDGDAIGGNIDDFLERQKVYEQLKKERLERKIIKCNQKNDYTFAPKINLTSDILMKTNSLRANEAIEDKVDRLYKQDYEEIQRRKEQLQSFYDAQFDFKPKINELSRFIGRDANINELNQRPMTAQLNRSQGNIGVGGVGQALPRDKECTFKPNINKEKYNHIQSNYKADDDIFNRINDEMINKKQKITGIQSALDKKKVEECKFKPEINHEVPNFETKEPMLMKGMAKHLDQMEKARKAKREKEEREKEVFITGDNWSRDNLITVPKPFNLSYQYQQKKSDVSMRKAKAMQSEMKECTFKPITNETKNREIIKQLLKD